ncbi:MAG: hypothetical protein WC728_01020 [Elusimicrobiota bacterium]
MIPAVVLACLLPGFLQAREPETVSVDLAADEGEPLQRASGFLHGFSPDGSLPPDSAVLPLKMRLHRTRLHATWEDTERMKSLGIQQQIVLADLWGYGEKHPGDGGDWTEWERDVSTTVRKAASLGLSVQWDLWNEPDHPTFWKRGWDQFLKTWELTHRAVRAADPSAVIVGPSWSDVRPGDARFFEFLDFCAANNVLPDYVSWHFPADAVKEAAALRAYVSDKKLGIRGMQINEYVFKDEMNPGKTAWHIAKIERAKVDGACHAVWADEDSGDLDGILKDPSGASRTGRWWVYERYAGILGRLARTEPSGEIELIAGKDGDAVRVLLGNKGGFSGKVTVRFAGLPKDPVRVVVERIPHARGKAVASPRVILKKDVMPPELTFRWKDARDAYFIRLSP